MTMIGILIFPDFQLLDAAGPISVLENPARCTGKTTTGIRVLAVSAGPVRSSSGVEMMARDFKSANAITTLVVAGGAGGGGAPAGGGPRAPRRRPVRGHARLRAAAGAARRAGRQRLLGRLCAGRGRPARRTPRHHPLGAD